MSSTHIVELEDVRLLSMLIGKAIEKWERKTGHSFLPYAYPEPKESRDTSEIPHTTNYEWHLFLDERDSTVDLSWTLRLDESNV